jgi:hypothetical protein
MSPSSKPVPVDPLVAEIKGILLQSAHYPLAETIIRGLIEAVKVMTAHIPIRDIPAGEVRNALTLAAMAQAQLDQWKEEDDEARSENLRS